ncbi:MAG: DUF5698 domain-containing protein [Actinobacteria bacterium]|nr:DUF5698 domain-containing protein [Actinomycetota bacterium]
MPDILLWSLVIFFARIVDVSLGTIRVNMIVRRKKIFAATIGFIEVAIFISVIVRIIKEVDNIYGVLSYAAGFAVGTVIGIIISEKLSRDLISTNIISKNHGDEIKKVLREEGYGITCYSGKGINGEVEIINIVCSQSNTKLMYKLVYSKDPGAFTASYMLDKIRGGFIRGLKKK